MTEQAVQPGADHLDLADVERRIKAIFIGSAGNAAATIVALARIIEGLSLGGEYGASATYLSEVADPRHRGFYSSFQYVTLIGGQLTAIIVLLLMQKVFLTPEELKAWGWRI